MATHIPSNAYLLLIGAMKCGTSTLYNYLAQSPEICGAKDKEPRYFLENPTGRLQRDSRIEKYEDLWNFDPEVHRYALEGTTGYTKFPMQLGVPKRIYDYGVRPKLLYIVRDPFERISSEVNYNQSRYGSNYDLIRCSYLIERSNYYLQLAKFREFFPSEDFLIIDFEDLKNNPGELVRRVCKFLEISTEGIEIGDEIINKTKLQSNLLKKLKGTSAPAVIRRLPAPVRRMGKTVLEKLDPPPEKYVMSDCERTFARLQLVEDMGKFADEYGFDVKKWGF